MTTLGAPAGLPISGSGCQCGGACELRLSYPACRAGYLQSGRSAHRDRERKPERQHLGRRVEPSISLGELGASTGREPATAKHTGRDRRRRLSDGPCRRLGGSFACALATWALLSLRVEELDCGGGLKIDTERKQSPGG